MRMVLTEVEARAIIDRFAEKQQGGHFACPRCGRMTMSDDAKRNALSRRASVYVCDTCGLQEALEDMVDSVSPLTAWAIVGDPSLWRCDE